MKKKLSTLRKVTALVLLIALISLFYFGFLASKELKQAYHIYALIYVMVSAVFAGISLSYEVIRKK